MVAEASLWSDVEGAVRAWAREAVTSLDGRVFFGANEILAKTKAAQVVISRVAGTDDACLIQFDVWAATKAAAASTAAELATAADALGRFVHADAVILHGARVDDVRWLPDEESNMPRYIVDVTFTATATSSG